MKRRDFLRKTLTSATTLAALTFAGTASAAINHSKEKPAIEPGADVIVTPGSPLIINGSADLGAVTLRGGQIVTRGGGEIRISRLIKE